MEARIHGVVHRFANNVDTDVILPGKYLSIIDEVELGKHAMEGIDPEFVQRVRPSDIIVAGTNFGCGSSRENAPMAIKACGVGAVIAKSFARIFYRNALNLGLPIFESPAAADAIAAGDELEIEPASGTIRNITQHTSYRAEAFPPFMQSLIDAGGLRPYVEQRLRERATGG